MSEKAFQEKLFDYQAHPYKCTL